MDLNQNYVDLTDEELSSYLAEVRAAFDALAALDTPSAAQITEAESLADHIDLLIAESAGRIEAAEALAERAAALKNRFPEDSEEEPEAEATEEEPEAEVVQGEVIAEETVPVPAAAKSNVVALAARTAKPKGVVKPSFKPVSITASADVPEFATGSKIETMTAVGQAWVNRLKGFSPPSGDGSEVRLQHYGVASFHLDYPQDLTIDRGSDEMAVLMHAANEKRLPGGSLVAAGGWCAPSEVIYDLCPGGTLDGLVSIPEVNVARGGFKYTQGPDFSALYAAGFCQTEAQAIAGTTKPCFEIPCPQFVEVRLDACGICVKIPILTQVGYPELIAAYLSEAMIAHQHAMNAKVLTAMATSAGAPVPFAGALGSTSGDAFEALLLTIAYQRQAQRLSLTESLEVVAPVWAREVFKADLYRRSRENAAPPTDADVQAIFAAAGANVQFVYDWEELADGAAWPDVIPLLVYPSGTFVKGVADVINLTAVYDAASLAVNTYTGLFFEQGILVAEMCKNAVAIEIPVCNAGRVGAADLTCATTP